MKKTSILLSSLVLMLFVGVGPSPLAQAKHGSDDDSSTTTSESDDSNDDTGSSHGGSETENETENGSESSSESHRSRGGSREDRQAEINARIALKRAELEKKLEQKQKDIKTKLEGKRLDLCNEREDKINTLLQGSIERSTQRLAVFQKIQKGVMEFYVSKGLNATDYDAAVKTADEKQAGAIAAIDAMAGMKFSCDTTDGSNPAGTIRQAAEARHTAMKAYRESVRSLIHVVKAAHSAAESSDGGQS